MPRRARTVFPGVPHHVTQRGNRRGRVFFSDGVEVIAYRLMPNHVHHVVMPSSAGGLHRLFKAVHGQYAQRINRMRGEPGHAWQGRFFSSALDSAYLLMAGARNRQRCPREIATQRRPESALRRTGFRCATGAINGPPIAVSIAWWTASGAARAESKVNVPLVRGRSPAAVTYIVTVTGESSVRPTTVPAGSTTSWPVLFAAAVPAAAPMSAPMILPLSLSIW
jgi:REP element-mobilizing transposase RayT